MALEKKKSIYKFPEYSLYSPYNRQRRRVKRRRRTKSPGMQSRLSFVRGDRVASSVNLTESRGELKSRFDEMVAK